MTHIQLPHQRLIVYQRALQLLVAVKAAGIRDQSTRDQAMRAARSVCLNIAEGASRWTKPDKRRAYVIARGEASEAAAAVEVAVQSGDAAPAALPAVHCLANEVVAMLTAMIR